MPVPLRNLWACSGPIWGQIDGKLGIAGEALAEVLQTIPAETELGLIAYGHRSKGACDIETLVAPAKGTTQAICDADTGGQYITADNLDSLTVAP